MAKFSQYTLTQVAGFDGQVLAQELVWNQKDFWNMAWSASTSTNGGWNTTSTPIDLTGATINAQIIRRQILNLKDGRTGLEFQIVDYPLVALIQNVTQTSSVDNTMVCNDTNLLFIDQPVRFTGSVFGGVAINTTYYVKSIITQNLFTISDTQGGTTKVLSTATGTMGINRVAPSPVNLPITNINTTNGTFTLTIDDDTWNIIAGDPELNIDAQNPVCFTGRVKISFPAVGSQPAYDECIFLLFLVVSDGVVN
jgi:hypothetical protein